MGGRIVLVLAVLAALCAILGSATHHFCVNPEPEIIVKHAVSSTIASGTPITVSASCVAPNTFVSGGCNPEYIGPKTTSRPSVPSTKTVDDLTVTCVFEADFALVANYWSLNAVASCCAP